MHARVCDVRDRAAVDALVEEVESGIGPVDVLISVAGIIEVGPAEAMTPESFDDAIDTMTRGPIHAALAVLPGMRRRGRGRIGTVTSIGGMVSPPHLLPYATAKFGAVGFSDGLAAALSGTGVTATTVVPGLMRTGSHQRARFSGDAGAEYAWFGPAASMPLLSMDADRAARRIVRAVLSGRPMVVLTPLAWVGIRVRGLAPATTTRVMGWTGRLLPGVPSGVAGMPSRVATPRARWAPWSAGSRRWGTRQPDATTSFARSSRRRCCASRLRGAVHGQVPLDVLEPIAIEGSQPPQAVGCQTDR